VGFKGLGVVEIMNDKKPEKNNCEKEINTNYSTLSDAERKLMEYNYNILRDLPVSNNDPSINALMAASILVSSSSISNVSVQQSNNQAEMRKELNKMKRLLEEKRDYIEFKEENVRKLKSYIVKIEKNMDELREENIKLKMYNQGTKDTIELYAKHQFQVNIANSANAEQTQTQRQSQSIELTI
jgi:hypothetical protein